MTVKDILSAIREVEQTPAGRGVELRMSFSQLVIERLRELGWTQKRLGDEARKKESYISRVVNGDQNCSFDRAAEILFALSMKAEFQRIHDQRSNGSNGNQANSRASFKEVLHGQDAREIRWTITAAEAIGVFEGDTPERDEFLQATHVVGC